MTSPPASSTATPETSAPPPTVTALSERVWLAGSAVVLLVATVLRAVELGLKPLHHDEGVNAFFLLGLLRRGAYQYNPSNYHGPTLYYFTLPLARLADSWHAMDIWTLRGVTVLFGVATVWLTLALRRYVGAVGALSAAALLAVSPGMVFFSRYYIHEMLFVFFTLGIVVAALRFYESDVPGVGGESKPGALAPGVAVSSIALVAVTLGTVYKYGALSSPSLVALFAVILVCLVALVALLWLYDGARSFYLALAAVSAALLFATKETAFISAGVLLIAWGMSEAWVRILAFAGWSRPPASKKKGGNKRAAENEESPVPLRLIERFGGWGHIIVLLVAAVAVFLFVNILYYSSFFTNPKGVADSLEALKLWKETGYTNTTHFHEYPAYRYVEWLVLGQQSGEWVFGEEPALFVLASVGAALALWKTRRRFPLFAALWGFGLLAAYSLIKYKTPWLALSWLLPFAISGGYVIDKLYRSRTPALRLAAGFLLGASLAVAAYQSYALNFVHYDSDKYPYVYAHTRREFHDLIAEMGRIAERTGDKYNAGINVAVENQEYWPLPWYVRDYKHVGYVGRVGETNDAIVLVKVSQVAEVEALLGARYRRVGGAYPLRPGVELALFGRSDLVDR